jgi:hypothetical protein
MEDEGLEENRREYFAISIQAGSEAVRECKTELEFPRVC